MGHIFLDTRDGRLALYLNGDLQFDRADERLYHEPLALVPIAVVSGRARGRPLRVLVLGGGDGLALREVLRARDVVEAHVVDHDPAVLRLARAELADLNRHALDDPRARIHAIDAQEFLASGDGQRGDGFDVVICDLTYPRDVKGAAVCTLSFFEHVKAALAPGGVVAVNGVSPELTPQAFGCLAATLGAAGLSSVPYAFRLRSFLAEGYGRWGFLFASSEPVTRRELSRLRFPRGAGITPRTILAGTEFPARAGGTMGAAPNRTDEILYYIANRSPLRWAPPFRPFRFTRSPSGEGPRLTVTHGFGEWLRQPAGARSLEELLGCLPLADRRQTRELVLEWSHHAEMLFRQIDLGAFVDRVLRQAASLPETLVRELRELEDRLRTGLPSMRELLEGAYRVFAVFLLVLLAANLFFPDNLYAKHGSGAGGSGSAFAFSAPGPSSAPFRFRTFSFSSPYRLRIHDYEGREYPGQAFVFADPARGPRPVSALLALTPELRLLESGAVAYGVPIPGFQFLLEPDRLAVADGSGRELVALYPGPQLMQQTVQSLTAQAPLIEKAIVDHRRWLEWTRWAAAFPPGREAVSELDELERIRRAIISARVMWGSAPSAPTFAPEPGWMPIFPGIFLETVREPMAILLTSEGATRRRSLAPPPVLTDEDRLLFWIFYYRLTALRDSRFGPTIERWQRVHGAQLGRRPAPAGGRS